MNEEIEIIETDIVFAVKIEVEAKVKKATMYSNQTEYKVLSLTDGDTVVDMGKNEDEQDLAMKVVKSITRNVIRKAKEYEEKIIKKK